MDTKKCTSVNRKPKSADIIIIKRPEKLKKIAVEIVGIEEPIIIHSFGPKPYDPFKHVPRPIPKNIFRVEPEGVLNVGMDNVDAVWDWLRPTDSEWVPDRWFRIRGVRGIKWLHVDTTEALV